MEITAFIQQGENGWLVGQLAQFPAVISQRRTMAKLQNTMCDALQFYLEIQAEETRQQYVGQPFSQQDFGHLHFYEISTNKN